LALDDLQTAMYKNSLVNGPDEFGTSCKASIPDMIGITFVCD